MSTDQMITPTVEVTFKVVGCGTMKFVGPSFADISREWGAFRDANSIPSSDVTGGNCYAGGLWGGRMSYNGKIWPERTWHPGHQPIYDPYTPVEPQPT